MPEMIKIPWPQLNDLIYSCGSVWELHPFSVKIVTEIYGFCKYDQAVVHFLDGNQNIIDHHIVNLDERWNDAYMKYYTNVYPEKYGYLLATDVKEVESTPVIRIYEWDGFPKDEFITEYIRPRGLKYTLSFLLFDLNGIVRTVIALDRIKDTPFSEEEISILKILVPHLNNQHKRFFMQTNDPRKKSKILLEMSGLTRRETEIVHLLCDGVAPANISKVLNISPNTTHKHITHIYAKMNVSNLQGLLVKLLGL